MLLRDSRRVERIIKLIQQQFKASVLTVFSTCDYSLVFISSVTRNQSCCSTKRSILQSFIGNSFQLEASGDDGKVNEMWIQGTPVEPIGLRRTETTSLDLGTASAQLPGWWCSSFTLVLSTDDTRRSGSPPVVSLHCYITSTCLLACFAAINTKYLLYPFCTI